MPSPPVAAPRPTVLVVDDTPENLAVLSELLRDQYRVRVANSGERALRAAQTEPRPDLILLDVMMPGMDGYEVLARLRAQPATADIAVIFVTALHATEDETRGLSLGAADFITKPLRPAVVLARVAAQIELKQARDLMQRQNTWLEAEVARRTREGERVRDLTLRALASLAETRDNETGHHILRTQHYVERLAQHLSADPAYAEALTPAQIELVAKAAPLHDIGKVGIPDTILLKPGPLTPAEWEIMRTHAALGAEALQRVLRDEPDTAPFAFLHVAIDIARHHHERWDGTGYPDRKAGADIPLSARLMALADVYDALTTRRPYKEPFPVEVARRIIVEGRGTHFDPAVVDAFLALEDEFRDIAHRFADPPRAGEGIA